MKTMKIYTYSYLRAQNITNPLKEKRIITKNQYNTTSDTILILISESKIFFLFNFHILSKCTFTIAGYTSA